MFNRLIRPRYLEHESRWSPTSTRTGDCQTGKTGGSLPRWGASLPATGPAKARSRRDRARPSSSGSASPAAAGRLPTSPALLPALAGTRARRTQGRAAQVAELPQLPSGLLVAVDQLVQLEHVDLAGLPADKAVPDSIEQQPQLLLVICGASSVPRVAELLFDSAR